MDDDPAYDISITHLDGTDPCRGSGIKAAVEATLTRHAVSKAHLGIALVNDDRIARLNRDHLHHEGSTDVLAYDLRDDPGPVHESQDEFIDPLDGEIVISVDTAEREAARRGHDTQSELALYAVHGTLHLLGYRDVRKEDLSRMRAAEAEILSSLGLDCVCRTDSR